jgi:23S rRNA (cytidine1920-2'-O)/16S rRNA (cytidine1409-2'-O)-methyltransferase
VISLEGVNLRLAAPDLIPEPIGLIVADVSFISLLRVLPVCLRWLAPGGEAVVLIKPQFELKAHQVDGGVVRDPALRLLAVDEVVAACSEHLGLTCLGVAEAAVKGPKGNQEYLAHFTAGNGPVCRDTSSDFVFDSGRGP